MSKRNDFIEKTIRRIHKEIAKIEEDALFAKYKGEIEYAIIDKEVRPESQSIFIKVYSRCRRDGVEQEKAMEIADACADRYKTVRVDKEVLKSIQSIVKELNESLHE